MRENCTSGSVRGASGNKGSYRKRHLGETMKKQQSHLSVFYYILLFLDNAMKKVQRSENYQTVGIVYQSMVMRVPFRLGTK